MDYFRDVGGSTIMRDLLEVMAYLIRVSMTAFVLREHVSAQLRGIRRIYISHFREVLRVRRSSMINAIVSDPSVKHMSDRPVATMGCGTSMISMRAPRDEPIKEK